VPNDAVTGPDLCRQSLPSRAHQLCGCLYFRFPPEPAHFGQYNLRRKIIRPKRLWQSGSVDVDHSLGKSLRWGKLSPTLPVIIRRSYSPEILCDRPRRPHAECTVGIAFNRYCRRVDDRTFYTVFTSEPENPRVRCCGNYPLPGHNRPRPRWHERGLRRRRIPHISRPTPHRPRKKYRRHAGARTHVSPRNPWPTRVGRATALSTMRRRGLRSILADEAKEVPLPPPVDRLAFALRPERYALWRGNHSPPSSNEKSWTFVRVRRRPSAQIFGPRRTFLSLVIQD
jgi:hypothetical protein